MLVVVIIVSRLLKTLNPKHEAQIPKSKTLNPKPKTLIPKPSQGFSVLHFAANQSLELVSDLLQAPHTAPEYTGRVD